MQTDELDQEEIAVRVGEVEAAHHDGPSTRAIRTRKTAGLVLLCCSMPLKIGASQLVVEERASRWDPTPTRTEYIHIAGRAALDFAVSDGAAMTQVWAFVRRMFGEWQGVAIAEEVHFSYADGRYVLVRDPTSDELRSCDFRALPKVTIPFQIQLPAAVLQKAEQDAIIILRIGAIANALQAVALRSRPSESTSSLVQQRDQVQQALIVASYMHEARKVIYHDKSHVGRLWGLAREGVRARREYIPPEIIHECQRLLDESSPLAKRLHKLRNDIGFHALPNEFRNWLRRQDPKGTVLLECAPDPHTSDVVFVASAQAVAEVCSDEAVAEFLAQARALAGALPYLIEAAIWGLITEQGIAHSQCVAFDAKGIFGNHDPGAAGR